MKPPLGKFSFLALIIPLAAFLIFSTGSAVGNALVIGAELDLSAAPPAVELPQPKCIDMSGIDQALEELMMLLRGRQAEAVASDISKSEKYSLLSFSMEPLESQMPDVDQNMIEPARSLASLFENGQNYKLRKVLVNREGDSAYFDDPQVFAVREDGRLVFAESNSRKVLVVDADGEVVASFGGRGEGEGQL